jgi:NAD-dependent deacetylase
MNCSKKYNLGYILESEGIPKCHCGGVIKPDVVLYGEALSSEAIRKSEQAISAADTLLIVGTSLSVYPAASLIHNYNGENLVIINGTSTPKDGFADLVINQDMISVFSNL